MERVTRIELALSAWEADVLPLNYTRGRGERVRDIGPTFASPAASMPHLLAGDRPWVPVSAARWQCPLRPARES